LASAAALTTSLALANPPAAWAGKKKETEKDEELNNYVDNIMDVAGPVLTNLGTSGIFGFCAAKTLKVCACGLMAIKSNAINCALSLSACMYREPGRSSALQ
jgi:hypothetical protein